MPNEPIDYHVALSAWLTGKPPHDIPDWEQFVRFASEILPSLPIHAALPPDISDFLSAVHTLNTERNLVALAQAREIAASFNHVGIEPVLLKGLANMLVGIYPDRGHRFMADIDVLVPKDQFDSALSVLQHLGYSADEIKPIELALGHSYAPLKRAGSLEIDLHHSTGLGLCETILPASELISRSLPVPPLRVPSPEHLIVHHILHCQIHESYRNRIWPPLRAMYDLVLLQRYFGAAVDWSTIETRFASHGQTATLLLYLKQVERTFGWESPIPLRLTGIIRLRWIHRKTLRRFPFLRFIDPVYFLKAGILPRVRRTAKISKLPGGWSYLLGRLFSRGFYSRLASDIASHG